ncbi:MAG: hypothetical protein Kow0031_10860 [Anaerolineae bacterium]
MPDLPALARPRRLPRPRLKPPPVSAPLPGPNDSSIAPQAVAELVRLVDEVARATNQSTYSVWRDWLKTTAPWLAAVGQLGELQTTVQLPPEVAAIYSQLEARYAALSLRYPAAGRVMSENFTQMFVTIKHIYPRLDLQAAAGQRADSPDILGQAFLASLGWPASWGRFFPPWSACVDQALHLAPGNASQQVYQALADAHIRAVVDLRRPIERPLPGGPPESWANWLALILPHSDLPLIIDTEISGPPLLLALAGRFSAWVTREMPLVQFEVSRLVAEPVLYYLAAISSMLSGLNGFYQQRNVANHAVVTEVERALQDAENRLGVEPWSTEPDPTAVWGSDEEPVR